MCKKCKIVQNLQKQSLFLYSQVHINKRVAQKNAFITKPKSQFLYSCVGLFQQHHIQHGAHVCLHFCLQIDSPLKSKSQ